MEDEYLGLNPCRSSLSLCDHYRESDGLCASVKRWHLPALRVTSSYWWI